MSKRYKKKPSEMLNIKYDLLAFMVDEFSYYLELELMDKEGNIRWNKIKYENDKVEVVDDPNEKLMKHIEENKKVANVIRR